MLCRTDTCTSTCCEVVFSHEWWLRMGEGSPTFEAWYCDIPVSQNKLSKFTNVADMPWSHGFMESYSYELQESCFTTFPCRFEFYYGVIFGISSPKAASRCCCWEGLPKRTLSSPICAQFFSACSHQYHRTQPFVDYVSSLVYWQHTLRPRMQPAHIVCM